MKKILIFLIFFIIFAIFIIFAFVIRETTEMEQVNFEEVKIGNTVFKVEIADTPTKQTRGLSGRGGLAENEGMLFIFKKPDIYGFWMKEMKFPIDIIWISGDKIVGFEENVPLEIKIYYPPQPVDKVLEVSAGVVKEQNIQIGQLIKIL